MIRHIFLKIIIVLLLLDSYASIGQLHCINYTSQDGLNANNVLCAVEDADGFIWFGTSNGLSRFDGHQFTDFSFIGDGAVPGSAIIRTLTIDDHNNLWAGTDKQGIFKYDKRLKFWTTYNQDMDVNHRLPSNSINFLHYTSDNKIWYGGDNAGLGCIDLNIDTVINHSILHLPRRSSWPNAIYDLAEKPGDSSVFYLVGHGYIMTFNRADNEFTILEEKSDAKISKQWEIDPHSITIAPNGNIWVGTWSTGIFEYDLKEKTLIKRNPLGLDKSVIWRSNVSVVEKDALWMAYRQHGVSKYNFKENQWDFYQSEAFNRNSLLHGEYVNIFISSEGHIWFMTTNGLSLVIPEWQAFTYFEDDISKTNFFLDAHYHEESEQYFFSYSGEDSPLKIYDKDMKLYKKISYVSRPGFDFNIIHKIIPHKDEIFLVSNVMYKYNFEKESIEPLEFKGIKHKGDLVDFMIDSDDNYWLLYSNYRLIKYDPRTEESKTYVFTSHQKHRSPHIIYHEMRMVDGRIWISAESELMIFDTKTFKVVHFRYQDSEFEKYADPSLEFDRLGSINQVLPLSDSCALILLSNAGLFKVCYNALDESIKIIDRKDKSALDQLQSGVEIIEGMNKDFWIATRNGLVHANAELEDFKVFGNREGLRSTTLRQGLSKSQGKLFIGMLKGFVMVDVDKLLNEKTKKNCIITGAELSQINLLNPPKEKYSYKNNDFSVFVSLPVYHDSKSVSYAHRLVNYHDDWVTTDYSTRSFRYDELPPGNYNFEVKARSASVPWSDVSSIAFRVVPPFWSTLWFRILIVISALTLIYFIYRFRLKLLLDDEKVKTKIAALESQALRTQMNPHFVFNSLNSIKSLILMDRKEDSISYLTQFSRLVREILGNSQKSMISLEKELELLSLYIDMELLRFHSKFTYSIEIDPHVNIYKSKLPPLIIQPFVENSLWHGLMHLEDCGELKVRIKSTDEMLEIEILDNGIGRAASMNIKSSTLNYKKKYFGSKISQDRIALLSNRATVIINDLFKAGVAAGTQVIIQIPQTDGTKD